MGRRMQRTLTEYGTRFLSMGKWTKITFAGWFVGLLFTLLLSGVFEGMGISRLQFFLGTGMAAGVGLAQWYLLRKTTKMSLAWMWYSIAGMSIPFLLLDVLKILGQFTPGPNYLIYCVCVGGLVAGVLQFSLLKPISPKASLWIPANFAGWLLATIIFFAVNYTKSVFSNNWIIFGANVALILGGGIVLGVITGLCIRLILKNRLKGLDIHDNN